MDANAETSEPHRPACTCSGCARRAAVVAALNAGDIVEVTLAHRGCRATVSGPCRLDGSTLTVAGVTLRDEHGPVTGDIVTVTVTGQLRDAGRPPA